jgi:hypothetical protein
MASKDLQGWIDMVIEAEQSKVPLTLRLEQTELPEEKSVISNGDVDSFHYLTHES